MSTKIVTEDTKNYFEEFTDDKKVRALKILASLYAEENNREIVNIKILNTENGTAGWR